MQEARSINDAPAPLRANRRPQLFHSLPTRPPQLCRQAIANAHLAKQEDCEAAHDGCAKHAADGGAAEAEVGNREAEQDRRYSDEQVSPGPIQPLRHEQEHGVMLNRGCE